MIQECAASPWSEIHIFSIVGNRTAAIDSLLQKVSLSSNKNKWINWVDVLIFKFFEQLDPWWGWFMAHSHNVCLLCWNSQRQQCKSYIIEKAHSHYKHRWFLPGIANYGVVFHKITMLQCHNVMAWRATTLTALPLWQMRCGVVGPNY